MHVHPRLSTSRPGDVRGRIAMSETRNKHRQSKQKPSTTKQHTNTTTRETSVKPSGRGVPRETSGKTKPSDGKVWNNVGAKRAERKPHSARRPT